MKQEYRTLTAEQRKVIKLLLQKKKPKLDSNLLAKAVEGKWNRLAIDLDDGKQCLALGTKDMGYGKNEPEVIGYPGFGCWLNNIHFRGKDNVVYKKFLSEITPGIIYKFRAFSKKELEAKDEHN
jgi:hypothetical protein